MATKKAKQADLDLVMDLGRKASKARYQHDEPTAKGHIDYMRRFCDTRPERKATLRQAFDDAYKAEYQAHFDSIKPTIRW